MAQVYIARHGETEWNTQARLAGCRDVPLSVTGWVQAHALAERVGSPVAQIYASPMLRAKDTAGVVGSIHGISVQIVDEFRDMAFGDWEGQTLDDIQALTPTLVHNWRSNPHATRIPGGETLSQVRKRVWRAYSKLVKSLRQTDRVLIVTHNAVCRLLILGALGMPLSQFRKVAQDNVALNRIDVAEDGLPRVITVNDTCSIGGTHAG